MTLPRPAGRALRAAPLLLLAACAGTAPTRPMPYEADRLYLDRQTRIVEMQAGTGALLVAPDLQGRVMTACVDERGASLGLVNRAAFAADAPAEPAFTNYGGSERFWVGPESGPYALFFDAGAAHERGNWRVPKDLDRGAFAWERTEEGVRMRRGIALENVRGTRFEMSVLRDIQPLQAAALESLVGPLPEGTQWTGWSTETVVANVGDEPWTRAGGLPSIWVIGMFEPGEDAWIIAPFRRGVADPDGGPPVRADYFGQVPEERFRTGDGFAVLRADGRAEGKIGVLRDRAVDRIAAWDPGTGVLTVVVFGPIDRDAPYLSEAWGETLEAPYYGDVANAYNSGGDPGFFELESSSPALELEPGGRHLHRHVTLHLRPGGGRALETLVRGALGLEWTEVRALMDA